MRSHRTHAVTLLVTVLAVTGFAPLVRADPPGARKAVTPNPGLLEPIRLEKPLSYEVALSLGLDHAGLREALGLEVRVTLHPLDVTASGATLVEAEVAVVALRCRASGYAFGTGVPTEAIEEGSTASARLRTLGASRSGPDAHQALSPSDPEHRAVLRRVVPIALAAATLQQRVVHAEVMPGADPWVRLLGATELGPAPPGDLPAARADRRADAALLRALLLAPFPAVARTTAPQPGDRYDVGGTSYQVGSVERASSGAPMMSGARRVAVNSTQPGFLAREVFAFEVVEGDDARAAKRFGVDLAARPVPIRHRARERSRIDWTGALAERRTLEVKSDLVLASGLEVSTIATWRVWLDSAVAD